MIENFLVRSIHEMFGTNYGRRSQWVRNLLIGHHC